MKIQYASDLHLEHLGHFPAYRAVDYDGADVLVIAGDIHSNVHALRAFMDWPVPVIYVHGNHEAYGERYDRIIDELRELCAGTNVHYLEREALVLDGVRFLGCCLWTDYELVPGGREDAMAEATRLMPDHRIITLPDGVFTTAAALREHADSRDWLQAQLDEDFDGATVIVTHHAPHPGSIHPRFADSPLNPAFVTDLTPLMGKPRLWIHGHVHDSFDYTVKGTRIVANPRGYALNRRAAATVADIQWENEAFDPTLTIEVDPARQEQQ